MKRLLRFAAKLYPGAWRTRYGDEFAALLDDLSPGWRDVFNVVQGALRMQLSMWGPWKTIAAAGLLGTLLAGWYSFRLPAQYVARAAVEVQPVDSLAEIMVVAFRRATLVEIMQRGNLYKSERNRHPMEDVVEMMRHSIRITRSGTDPNAFVLEFSYPDAAAARDAGRQLVSALVLANIQVSRQYPDDPRSNVQVLDPVSVSDNRAPRIRWPILLIGMAVGCALAALAALLRRRPVPWSLRVARAGFTGMLLAGTISITMTDRFVSNAVVRSVTTNPPILERVVSAELLRSIIDAQGSNLYTREKSMDAAIALMRRDLKITRLARSANSQMLHISFTYADRVKAQMALREIIDRTAATYIPETSGRTPKPPLLVIDAPSFPEFPVFPNRLVVVLLGLVAGLLLGACWPRARVPGGRMAAGISSSTPQTAQ
jgi:hypothetical protein